MTVYVLVNYYAGVEQQTFCYGDRQTIGRPCGVGISLCGICVRTVITRGTVQVYITPPTDCSGRVHGAVPCRRLVNIQQAAAGSKQRATDPSVRRTCCRRRRRSLTAAPCQKSDDLLAVAATAAT